MRKGETEMTEEKKENQRKTTRKTVKAKKSMFLCSECVFSHRGNKNSEIK